MTEKMPDQKNTGKNQTDFGFAEVKETDKEEKVREVFDSVAPKYDLMNDVLSFGMHRLWKHHTIAKAGVQKGWKVLDIASGTGDLALKFAQNAGPEGEVWATDINHEMLRLGAQRFRQEGVNCRVALCDCEHVPLPITKACVWALSRTTLLML